MWLDGVIAGCACLHCSDAVVQVSSSCSNINLLPTHSCSTSSVSISRPFSSSRTLQQSALIPSCWQPNTASTTRKMVFLKIMQQLCVGMTVFLCLLPVESQNNRILAERLSASMICSRLHSYAYTRPLRGDLKACSHCARHRTMPSGNLHANYMQMSSQYGSRRS